MNLLLIYFLFCLTELIKLEVRSMAKTEQLTSSNHPNHILIIYFLPSLPYVIMMGKNNIKATLKRTKHLLQRKHSLLQNKIEYTNKNESKARKKVYKCIC